MYSAKRVKLDLDQETRRSLWALRRAQRQSYNIGIELALGSLIDTEQIISDYSAFKTLTDLRKDAEMSKHSVFLQRAGIKRGLDAVRKWRKTRASLQRNVDYWQNRALLDQSERVNKQLVRAEDKLTRHIELGTDRLFRSRKREERAAGSALYYDTGAVLQEDHIKLPGKIKLKLRDQIELDDNDQLTQAVQIVDITDLKGKITRRTQPEHRTYQAYVTIDLKTPETQEPESINEVLGIDLGITVAAYCSNNDTYEISDQSELTEEIKDLQREIARKAKNSRRRLKLRHKRRKLSRKLSNRRKHERRAIAKKIATTPLIKEVALEDLDVKKMGSSRSRWLNRNLSNSAFTDLSLSIERASQKQGLIVTRVDPYKTSKACSKCGAEGERETQALFSCSACGLQINADLNAAKNIRAKARSRRQIESSSDAAKSASQTSSRKEHYYPV